MQLHEFPFQFLIKLLNWIRFLDVLIWKGRLFQTFGPYTFKLFAPKVTWFHLGVSRFNLYCSLTNLLFSLTLKILFKNSGFSWISRRHLKATYLFHPLRTHYFPQGHPGAPRLPSPRRVHSCPQGHLEVTLLPSPLRAHSCPQGHLEATHFSNHPYTYLQGTRGCHESFNYLIFLLLFTVFVSC